MARGFSFGLPSILDDLPFVGEEFKTKGRKTSRPRRPSSLYDVPIPPKMRAEVKRRIAKAEAAEAKRWREKPPSIVGGLIPIPDLTTGKLLGFGPDIGLRRIVGNVKEMGAGAIPAAKTVAKAGGHDAKALYKADLGLPSKKTVKEYSELLKWTLGDVLPGDRKKGKEPPKSDSHLLNLFAQIVEGTYGDIEEMTPERFWDSKDRQEARKSWEEGPVYNLLNSLLVGNAVSRPLSIAKHTRAISKANEINPAQALKAGLKESYRPGAARRAGLHGGIAPRILSSPDVGSVAGRPWSRSPLMREAQRRYDELWEANPTKANERVAARRQKLEGEEERRIRLELDELQRPIARLIYGKLGRAAGAFGLKKNMSAKERAIATALVTVLQNQRHLSYTHAIKTVEDDLIETLQSGRIELPPTGANKRGRTAPLTEEQKQHLSQQIIDLQQARRQFDNGGIDEDEFKEGLEALSVLAEKAQEAGLDVLQRTKQLDPDAMDEIRQLWDRRSQVVARRLVSRGRLSWRSLEQSPERAGWLDALTEQWGEEKARYAVVAADQHALSARPQDPASFWEDRIGAPTGEAVEDFVARADPNTLYQLADRAGTRQLVQVGEIERLFGTAKTNIFYSPLQRWVDENWEKKYGSKNAAVNAQTVRNDVKKAIGEKEYDNAQLDNFFDRHAEGEKVTQREFQEHLSHALNAYNIEEVLYVKNGFSPEYGDFRTAETATSTQWDSYMDGALISRRAEVGEYAELVLRLHGDRGHYVPYGETSRELLQQGRGKGFAHWQQDNVIAHVRFHIFEEDGVRKMLIEEIQSDWIQEAKKFDYRGEVTPEAREEARVTQEQIDSLLRKRTNLQRELNDLDDKIDQIQYEVDTGQIGRHAGQDSISETHREQDAIQLELDDLYPQIRQATRRKQELLDTGTPPPPLGEKYYRTVLRRLAREAVEQGVDEIVFQDPLTQLIRANPDLNPAGENPPNHLSYVESRIPLFERTVREADERVDIEIEKDGYTRETISPERLESYYLSSDMYAKKFLKQYRTWRQLYGETFPNALRKEYGLDPVERRTNAYQGRLTTEDYYASQRHSMEGDMPGAVLKVNDQMREAVKDAQALYQRSPDYKALPRGATEFLADGKTQLHIFSEGGIDTWIHELGHVALHDLGGDDLKTINDFFGGGKDVAEWTQASHENFARTYERYWRRGVAPTPELSAVFAKISAWMRVVWEQTKQRNPQLPEEVREVFDRMVGSAPELGDGMQTYGYFPHRDLYELTQEDYRGTTRPPATGNVIGVPRRSREALELAKNELLLYQTGRLNPDPAGLVDVLMRRWQLQNTLDARDHLFNEIGRSLEDPMPKTAWLVRNPYAPPEKISPKVRAAAKGQELRRPNVDDLDSSLTLTPDEFKQEVIGRASENKSWLEDSENVRWVPEEYVRKRFPEVFSETPRGKGWSWLRILTSMQRFSGIYGRPLAYVAGNVPFNVMALMATMPVANLRSAKVAIGLKRRDPALYRSISSESGQARSEAGLPGVSYVRPQNRTQAIEQKVTRLQRGSADVLSGVADDPYRVTAFLSNARKRGYSSDAELRRLIEENGSDLEDVRQLTREQLLDFDALNPANRRLASNLLYLWPFMYASTKWPMMYAREYPNRAALAAQGIQQEPERLDPSEVANFWKEKGIDLSSINPLGPIGTMAEDLDLFLKDPTSMDLTVLKERLAPTIDLAVEALGGGKKNAIQNFIRGTVPGASEAGAFMDEKWRGSKMYADRDTPWPYLLTRHMRFAPRELNEEKMKETIQQARQEELSGTTLEREKKADKDKINRYLEDLGGVDYGEELQQSVDAWWEYQEAVGQKKESTGQRKLSPVQQAEILGDVVREHFPEMADQLSTDDELRAAKDKASVEEYVKDLRGVINEGRTWLFDDWRSYASE